ncbi:[methyl-Co(III) methanol-specific corrinoid protein]:coenzyme M methyltransferase [Sphaerochaeta associata]|uniref:MtaA/CmuA family methyltransferase n=1 Tax=Sphaerochaeta associata TaxID=1129264 RepID=A0ABY4DAR9_9SPIR|nr:MtaA/CmuA family methyltransferase [Sphaerochaeta associata]UOM51376.1 MtaA/CmuA family methyltransferase [Sphaerochaeta associata]SMP62534.1 [methyl-Co(III) methanol-specific corrinoid protein]:coenzyme M methyltransferase [Sphaerochaeta associata]
MNSRERVFAAIKGKDFDVYPAITPTSVATLEGMKASNAYFPAAHTHPMQMADLAAVGYEVFGFDSIAPYFSVHLEAAALGAKVDFSDPNTTPFVTQRPMNKIDDFSLPPNFLAKQEFQALLKTISILKSRYKQSVPIIGKVIGPWTLAYNLYGVENLILDTILEPAKTQALITELSSIPLAFALAQFDAGADMITWAEHATSDLVSPQIYERFLFPVHKKAANIIQVHGPLILHICGNVMDRLSLIANTGIKLFHIDSRNPLKEALKIAGSSLILTGAINNPVSLVQGTPYSITQEVIRTFREGISLVSPECALPTNVPTQNLRAITETAHHMNPHTLPPM